METIDNYNYKYNGVHQYRRVNVQEHEERIEIILTRTTRTSAKRTALPTSTTDIDTRTTSTSTITTTPTTKSMLPNTKSSSPPLSSNDNNDQFQQIKRQRRRRSSCLVYYHDELEQDGWKGVISIRADVERTRSSSSKGSNISSSSTTSAPPNNYYTNDINDNDLDINDDESARSWGGDSDGDSYSFVSQTALVPSSFVNVFGNILVGCVSDSSSSSSEDEEEERVQDLCNYDQYDAATTATASTSTTKGSSCSCESGNSVNSKFSLPQRGCYDNKNTNKNNNRVRDCIRGDRPPTLLEIPTPIFAVTVLSSLSEEDTKQHHTHGNDMI
mmetsp:Transcript_3164/g.6822  ORF Transcript_3164/g.6822 Transcript_3164/m.6822 type:complete len:329 (+) Transcript_3164:122-1108(+)|eukprot:CAMPEP_0168236168 /NCGR_PEP_ID=MMETSP0140_2-20121125/19369_1 /TAXON_ID=44445 /ORGANISM="Pseudo-nitzschia australis, Strain 10249 10 AB" /LENGTH=328 /DNA_ID=CAMNT_0008169437 /DNA_START=248 /DNA_END=1234 /DNA_ORIENTATION=+